MCYLNINALSIFYCMFYPIGKKKKKTKDQIQKSLFKRNYNFLAYDKYHIIS